MAARIKFYTDEHVSKVVVKGLRGRGVDVLTIAEAGTLGASDDEHLERAKHDKRVIFTQDADFLHLHAAGKKHAGIVYATQGTSISKIISGLLLIYQVLDVKDMENHVEYL